MTLILSLAAAIAVLLAIILIGLVATWYFADDEKLLAPATANRVTFKRVVKNFFHDVAELLALQKLACFGRRLWGFWGPRLTNRALIALIFGDLSIAASGQSVWDFIGAHPLIVVGIVVMHLLTPLTPEGAPTKLPPAQPPAAEPGGLRGPGAEAEARAAA